MCGARIERPLRADTVEKLAGLAGCPPISVFLSGVGMPLYPALQRGVSIYAALSRQ